MCAEKQYSLLEKTTTENGGLGYTSTYSFNSSVKVCSAFLRGLKAKLMPLLGAQQDTFVIRMPAGPSLRPEAKVFELENFIPPL